MAPFDGQITEVCVKLNETVQEGQLLFVLEKASTQQNGIAPLELPQPS
jgi:pyruvate carboxylase